jgi:hypothetical protein
MVKACETVGQRNAIPGCTRWPRGGGKGGTSTHIERLLKVMRLAGECLDRHLANAAPRAPPRQCRATRNYCGAVGCAGLDDDCGRSGRLGGNAIKNVEAPF